MKTTSPFIEETDQYINQIKAGLNSILVTVRVRPLSTREKAISAYQTVKVLEEKLLVLTEPQNNTSIDVLRKNRNKDSTFAFDYAFDQSVGTQDIYEKVVGVLLEGLFDGFNATVLAYGATSCGKTFTMIGQGEHPGIMALSVLDILNSAKQLRKSKHIKFKASYIEIYNENIKDLLISQDKNFELREDPKQGISIAGITEVTVNNLNQLKMILKVGAKNRTKQATGSNQNSSRSHAILQIQIQTKDKAQSTIEQTNISKLSLVDLAGSERASKTTNRGERMVQGAKINQSLLTLGNCIQTLSEASQKGLKNVFVPYRGSKLTRLLKDSLGGNCRTVMIAHVTPAVSAFQETYNTIIYANRAKNIKNNATRNILNAQTHITNYVNVINSLKRENEQLKYQLSTNKKDSSRNNNSLPLLQNAAYDEQIQKYEKSISSNIKQEQDIFYKIANIDKKIENMAFEIFADEIQKSGQATIKKKSQVVGELAKQKIELQKRLQDLEFALDKIQKQVHRNDILGNIGQPYVLNQLRQKKIKLQAQALKLKQLALQEEKTLISAFLQKIKTHFKVRDRIIESQKILIKKNNIISRITYSQMNFSMDGSKQNQRDYSLPKKNPRMQKNFSIQQTIPVKAQKILGNNQQGMMRRQKKQIDNSLEKLQNKIDLISSRIEKKNNKRQKRKISEDGTSEQDAFNTIRAKIPPTNNQINRIQSHSKNQKQLSPKLKKIGYSNDKINEPEQKNKKKKLSDNKFEFVFLPH